MKKGIGGVEQPMRGLSSQEVNEAISLGKINEQVTSSAKTEKDIIKENVFTYFNLIFLILSILLIVAGIIGLRLLGEN